MIFDKPSDDFCRGYRPAVPILPSVTAPRLGKPQLLLPYGSHVTGARGGLADTAVRMSLITMPCSTLFLSMLKPTQLRRLLRPGNRMAEPPGYVIDVSAGPREYNADHGLVLGVGERVGVRDKGPMEKRPLPDGWAQLSVMVVAVQQPGLATQKRVTKSVTVTGTSHFTRTLNGSVGARGKP